MKIQLRGEMPGDEEAIDVVACRAFREMDEAHMVRLMRQHYHAFDRRFSVTAWDGEQMVGHILLSPARIRFMDETVRALAVGPVGVVPERQRQGIGGKMLDFGHRIGKSEGFALAFLAGIPSYYPRYGYQACYGFAKVTIDTKALPSPSQELSPWPVRPADIPWLVERMAAEWPDVDFSWQWGTSLGEWTLAGTDAVVWRTEASQRAAYTLRLPGWQKKKELKMLLADDPMLARDVIATIKPQSLEHHPSGWLARNVLDPEWATAEANSSSAAMAYELEEGVLQPYVEALQAEERLSGSCNWPLPSIVC